MRLGARTKAGLAVWLASMLATAALATTPLESVSVSLDVAVATTLGDEDVSADDLLGSVLPAALGALPQEADVTAYHIEANGDQLFSLDTTAMLPGLFSARPGDVVRYDGASYALAFDAVAAGVPDGVGTNAVSRTVEGDLLLSFDTAVDLGAFTAHDHDVVAYDGATFRLAFDGLAMGLPQELDVDAVHDLGDGGLGLSLDGSGQLGSVHFDDDDILEYDSVSRSWSVLYDASTEHAGWGEGPDLDAVNLPEPDQTLLTLVGTAALLLVEGLRGPLSRARGLAGLPQPTRKSESRGRGSEYHASAAHLPQARER